jgi:hypothetical protein
MNRALFLKNDVGFLIEGEDQHDSLNAPSEIVNLNLKVKRR